MADQERRRTPLLSIVLKIFLFLLVQCYACGASAGDRDSSYGSCVESCQKNGCIDDACFSPCSSSDAEQPFYMKLTRWDCPSECRYQCMVKRASERALTGQPPVKYHGKWPFQRLYGMQEPASVLFSVSNLLAHVWGLSSFLIAVYYRLPQGRKGPYYEFVGLWTIYGLLSINSWLWSAVFHTRDTPTTETLDYSSAIAVLGFSFILAIIRTCGIKVEATRVMVSAPLIGFVATHICYLNFYEFDYGWNMIVCATMGVIQLLSWLIWSAVSKHPSRLKVWTAGIATLAAMLLELYDFPPLGGYLDAHSLWHLVTIPITCLWWSFVKEDAAVRILRVVKKSQAVKKAD